MARTVCNLCGGKNFLATLNREDLVVCRSCGLAFFLKQPEKKELVKLYNREIFSPAKYYKKLENSDRKNFISIFNEVKKYKNSGTLLDIGCSTGTFLNLARRAGWKVYGLEINKTSFEECRRKNLDVKNAVLEEKSYKNSFFDWIHMGDVIEHVKDPDDFLKISYKKLKKGGILTISTPDIAKFMARKFQIKPHEHLFYFNKNTIRMYLEKSGFTVISIKNYSPYRNLSALSESSTFNKSFIKLIFRAVGVLGDLIVKLPLEDEMLVIAKKN